MCVYFCVLARLCLCVFVFELGNLYLPADTWNLLKPIFCSCVLQAYFSEEPPGSSKTI